MSVTAQLTNRTSGVPIANVPVDLTIGADTDIGPCTGPFQSTSPTTNATGWVSAVLSVPFCYLGAHALINASVTTTTLYGTNGLRIGVNLLGFVPGLAFLTGSPWAYVTYSVVLGAAVVGGAWIGRPREPAVGPTGPPAGAVASGSTPGPPASPAPPGGALPSRPPTAPVAPPPPPSPAPPPAPPGGGPPPPRSPA